MLEEFQYGRAVLAAEVDNVTVAALQRQGVGFRNVTDKDIVPQLFSVSKDRYRFAIHQLAGKNRDDPRFAMRILTWPEHVGIAQDRVVEFIEQTIQVEIVLH